MPPATALLDRLNVHSMQGFDVRREVLGIVANHLKPGMFAKAQPPVGDGAFRRLAQKVDLELLARVAQGRLRRTRRRLRLLGDGLVRRARARARRRARAARAAGQGPPSASSSASRRDPRSARCCARCTSASWMARVADFDAAFALAREIAQRQADYTEATMRRAACLLSSCCLAFAAPAAAQQKEPIGRFAVDVRGDLRAAQGGAERRDRASTSTTGNLPTRSLGLVGGAHVYPLRLGK